MFPSRFAGLLTQFVRTELCDPAVRPGLIAAKRNEVKKWTLIVLEVEWA